MVTPVKGSNGRVSATQANMKGSIGSNPCVGLSTRTLMILSGLLFLVYWNSWGFSTESSLFAISPLTHLRASHIFANPTSFITWCEGKMHSGPGRCSQDKLMAIPVTDNLAAFQLLLRQAMDARRNMTNDEHEAVKEAYQGHLIRDRPFQQGGSSAYDPYALYAHGLVTKGLVDPKKQLWCEFGVFTGASVNLTAIGYNEIEVHGFDTFTGLPEDWVGHHGKGHFSQGGSFPPVEKGVQLHKGLFKDTLVPFIREKRGKKIAGMNIDCDLYRGAIESLNMTHHMWAPGTMLHFHELQQSPKSREKSFTKQEESVALHEFLSIHPGTILEILPIQHSYSESVILFVVSPPDSKIPM